MAGDRTTQLQHWIDQLRRGDTAAREALIGGAQGRLRALAHDLLASDRLRRWEETDDVLQEALITLHRSLAEVWPETVQEFLRLAAFHIRRALVKFARHYYGPHGKGTNHASHLNNRQSTGVGWSHVAAEVDTPGEQLTRAEQLACMCEAVEHLPDEERDVTEMLWLHGLSQVEVAAVLEITDRTVRRRWQRARLKLTHTLIGQESRNLPAEREQPAR